MFSALHCFFGGRNFETLTFLSFELLYYCQVGMCKNEMVLISASPCVKIRGLIPLHRCAAIDIYDLLLRENAKQCDGIQKDYRLSRPLFGVVEWEMTDSSGWGVNNYFQ